MYAIRRTGFVRVPSYDPYGQRDRYHQDRFGPYPGYYRSGLFSSATTLPLHVGSVVRHIFGNDDGNLTSDAQETRFTRIPTRRVATHHLQTRPIPRSGGSDQV
jgi:hypothetical protein